MAGIAFVVRSQFRARWRAWAAVALLVGVLGGVVLVATAGARRTGSAYERFLFSSHGADVLVSPRNTGFPDFYRALGQLPGVRAVAPVIGFGGVSATDAHAQLLVDASADGRWGSAVERPKLIAGRMVRPGAANEIVATPAAARAHHLHVGSVLRAVFARSDANGPDPVHDPTLRLKVVGIGVGRDSIVPVNALANGPMFFAGPGFARRLGSAYRGFDAASVVLAPGTSAARVGARAQALAGQYPGTGGGLFVADLSQQAAKVKDAIRPQAVALDLFAIISGLAALCAVGLVVARQLLMTSTENPTLATLGMRRGQLLAVALVQVGLVAAAGGLLAVGVAIAASPVMPIGPARLAEPNPGLSFDWPVFGAGFVAVVATVLAVAAVSGWRLSRIRRLDGWWASSPRGIRLATRAAQLGASPPITIGISQAVDPGRGRRALPTRGALAGVSIAIAVTIASVTFGFNLSRLVETPRLYGQSWDVTADVQFGEVPMRAISAQLHQERGVEAWTFAEHLDVAVGGRPVPAVGFLPGHGHMLAPTVIAGRAARTTNEIALGTSTLNALHRHLGQSINVTPLDQSGGKPSTLRIVGKSVFPFFGLGSFTPTGLGVGAQLRNHLADAGSNGGVNLVLVKIAAGPHHDADAARVAGHLTHTPICIESPQCTVTTTTPPVDVVNYARVVTTPTALAILMALIAALTVTYLVAAAQYRRRHEFAILKTLGFTRRQVLSTVMGQASTLTALALLLGLPAGIVLGRFVWTQFADSLAVADQPITPTVIVLAVPIALLAACLLAIGPGIRAGRLRPAAVFRTD